MEPQLPQIGDINSSTSMHSTFVKKKFESRSGLGNKEMSFYIRPSLGGRKGWKIMQESGEEMDDPELLQRVVDMIRDMEFSGIAVPERITLKV